MTRPNARKESRRTRSAQWLGAAEELAVGALLIRYATAVDTKDWTLFETCFTADCDVRYGERRWHRVDRLTADFAEAHDPLDESMHRVLNVAVHPGDMDEAATRSYCDAIMIRRGAAGGDVLQVWGVYTDRVARTAAGWRIAAREFRAVRYRGALAVLGSDTGRVARGFGDALHG